MSHLFIIGFIVLYRRAFGHFSVLRKKTLFYHGLFNSFSLFLFLLSLSLSLYIYIYIYIILFYTYSTILPVEKTQMIQFVNKNIT